MRYWLAGLAALLITGCVATDERPMNRGEKTIISDQVAQRLDEADGRIDTRDENDIVCERIRTTGTHLVTRLCYTLAEKRAMEENNQDKTVGRFGKQRCLSQSSVACQAGLERPGTGTGSPR